MFVYWRRLALHKGSKSSRVWRQTCPERLAPHLVGPSRTECCPTESAEPGTHLHTTPLGEEARRPWMHHGDGLMCHHKRSVLLPFCFVFFMKFSCHFKGSDRSASLLDGQCRLSSAVNTGNVFLSFRLSASGETQRHTSQQTGSPNYCTHYFIYPYYYYVIFDLATPDRGKQVLLGTMAACCHWRPQL